MEFDELKGKTGSRFYLPLLFLFDLHIVENFHWSIYHCLVCEESEVQIKLGDRTCAEARLSSLSTSSKYPITVSRSWNSIENQRNDPWTGEREKEKAFQTDEKPNEGNSWPTKRFDETWTSWKILFSRRGWIPLPSASSLMHRSNEKCVVSR